ncbi:MAG: hypothetical protein ACI9HA_003785, partial [Dinoroseobacter sp.]
VSFGDHKSIRREIRTSVKLVSAPSSLEHE